MCVLPTIARVNMYWLTSNRAGSITLNTVGHDKGDSNHRSHDPTFPKKIHLGPRSVGYFHSEIVEWLKSKQET